ncbi:hypothetical protein UWK_00489 [Desulfocapsa sulfexigens DSM 10523]|uniref:Uncharacterized protein n=1 Tax=Desulfocapsa sulfexigens (strain DSM 10523 / SB164P1) TaxID=1167006 RepID=M1P5W6_DESSD|nr:hypothetical protein UWK_00489 [Desulfocapsa sulfexigens DSM 10523]
MVNTQHFAYHILKIFKTKESIKRPSLFLDVNFFHLTGHNTVSTEMGKRVYSQYADRRPSLYILETAGRGSADWTFLGWMVFHDKSAE